MCYNLIAKERPFKVPIFLFTAGYTRVKPQQLTIYYKLIVNSCISISYTIYIDIKRSVHAGNGTHDYHYNDRF